ELHENGEVQVLRGDDTSYSTKSSTEEGTPAKDRIESEDDLYSIEKDSDDAELEGQSKRVIKTDNIIALSYGRVSADDTTGDSSSHSYVAGSWAYQLIDNGWLELQYGRGLLVDHPSSGIDTSLSDIILRAKYTFAIPFNAYLQPYLGYQIRSAKNSDAGQDSDTVTLTQAQRDAELNAVDDVAKQQFIFGVTALKRMVPGWFIRLDLGLDVMSVGIALEF
ncbi:MAG: hypothetical protein KBD63_04325, partial [Bacteriovoracaceae bacterium]|nr:hypothetical protein [Bacteriovoracaceae bacterium]